MAAPSVDFKDLLSTAGVGTWQATTGWALAVSREPATPDQVVTIYDTGGQDPNAKWLLDNPTVQVRVRGSPNDYPATYAKAIAVKDALLGLTPQTLDSIDYVGVWMVGDVIFIGYDELQRPRFTTNWQITREPASGTYRTAL